MKKEFSEELQKRIEGISLKSIPILNSPDAWMLNIDECSVNN
jgi:hypothetical protein